MTSQFTQKEIQDKITAAIATVIRIDPRLIADLSLLTSMEYEFNEISLADAALGAATLLSKRKGCEYLGDAILKYGKVNGSIADFYMSIFRGLDKMPTIKSNPKNQDNVVENELRMLENEGNRRALSKGCFETTLRYSR